MCIYMYVLFDLFIHIHTINERKIASSRLIHQTRRRIARREIERERYIDYDMMKDNDE